MILRRSHNDPEGPGTPGPSMVYVTSFLEYVFRSPESWFPRKLPFMSCLRQNATTKMTGGTAESFHGFGKQRVCHGICEGNRDFYK